jgi:hypothetical protein
MTNRSPIVWKDAGTGSWHMVICFSLLLLTLLLLVPGYVVEADVGRSDDYSRLQFHLDELETEILISADLLKSHRSDDSDIALSYLADADRRIGRLIIKDDISRAYSANEDISSHWGHRIGRIAGMVVILIICRWVTGEIVAGVRRIATIPLASP